jgi:hypothetical protein
MLELCVRELAVEKRHFKKPCMERYGNGTSRKGDSSSFRGDLSSLKLGVIVPIPIFLAISDHRSSEGGHGRVCVESRESRRCV